MFFKNFAIIVCSLLMGITNSHSTKLTDNSEQNSNKPKIGILTSGGDCSGLNSIIYAAYKKASSLGYELIGFHDGVHGMISNDYEILNDKICNPAILKESGSILGSNTNPLTDENGKSISKQEGDQKIIDEYHKLNLKGLIYIGGDGSIGIMKNILKTDKTLDIIAIPKTIDNDIGNTDVSVGFSTVSAVVTNDVSNIISTAKSHHRVMVVEVMGRSAGYIALTSGLAVGADAIIIPEVKCDVNKLLEKIKSVYDSGKKYAIVVVSEGVEVEGFEYKDQKLSDVISRKNYGGIAKFLADKMKAAGFQAKAVVLGHTQRGGTTSVEDRVLAQKFGAKAIRLIDSKDTGYLLGIKNNKISKTKLSEIKVTTRNITLDDENLLLAKDLGIYVGEIEKNDTQEGPIQKIADLIKKE